MLMLMENVPLIAERTESGISAVKYRDMAAHFNSQILEYGCTFSVKYRDMAAHFNSQI